MRKKMIFSCVLMVLLARGLVYAQTSQSQTALLQNYAGYWVSSTSPDGSSAEGKPEIKMICSQKMGGLSLQVDVFQLEGDEYIPILSELIGYDSLTDILFASGQNKEGVFFTGKGKFITDSQWIMQDQNLQGEFTQKVTFQFLNDYNEVLVEGNDRNDKSLWKVRYIKSPNHPSFK